jgi:hypothetical protein
MQDVNETLADMSAYPQSFWEPYLTHEPVADETMAQQWAADSSELLLAVVNGVYYNFGIEAPPDLDESQSELEQHQQTSAIGRQMRLVVSRTPSPGPVCLRKLTTSSSSSSIPTPARGLSSSCWH